MKSYRDNGGDPTPKGFRAVFGVFMVLVYLAVGLMFIFNVFNIFDTAISCTVGGLLIAYGIWRGIRMYLGSR